MFRLSSSLKFEKRLKSMYNLNLRISKDITVALSYNSWMTRSASTEVNDASFRRFPNEFQFNMFLIEYILFESISGFLSNTFWEISPAKCQQMSHKLIENSIIEL